MYNTGFFENETFFPFYLWAAGEQIAIFSKLFSIRIIRDIEAWSLRGKWKSKYDLLAVYSFFRDDVYWALRFNIQAVCIRFSNFKAVFPLFER